MSKTAKQENCWKL